MSTVPGSSVDYHISRATRLFRLQPPTYQGYSSWKHRAGRKRSPAAARIAGYLLQARDHSPTPTSSGWIRKEQPVRPGSSDTTACYPSDTSLIEGRATRKASWPLDTRARGHQRVKWG